MEYEDDFEKIENKNIKTQIYKVNIKNSSTNTRALTMYHRNQATQTVCENGTDQSGIEAFITRTSPFMMTALCHGRLPKVRIGMNDSSIGSEVSLYGCSTHRFPFIVTACDSSDSFLCLGSETGLLVLKDLRSGYSVTASDPIHLGEIGGIISLGGSKFVTYERMAEELLVTDSLVIIERVKLPSHILSHRTEIHDLILELHQQTLTIKLDSLLT
jgi:hypothetical protein